MGTACLRAAPRGGQRGGAEHEWAVGRPGGQGRCRVTRQGRGAGATCSLESEHCRLGALLLCHMLQVGCGKRGWLRKLGVGHQAGAASHCCQSHAGRHAMQVLCPQRRPARRRHVPAAPPPAPSSTATALIRAVRPFGTRTAAVYVNLAPGVSWQGRMELQQRQGGRGEGAVRGTWQKGAGVRAGAWLRAPTHPPRGSHSACVHAPARAHRAWMAWHCVNR